MRVGEIARAACTRGRSRICVSVVAYLAGISAAVAAPPAVKLASAPLVATQTGWNSYPTSTTHTVGLGGSTTRPPEIKKLARALGAGRYSTDVYAARVFDYVRLNVETEFRFGLSKGARGAVLDRSGTPFDQAHLMVELLREGLGASVPVSYQIGPVVFTAAEFGRWSGLVHTLNQTNQTFTVDAKAACTLLADGGIPARINGSTTSCTGLSGALTSIELLHIWVAVNGKVYDPSYKRHTLKTGIDLPAAMGCGTAASPTCGNMMETSALTDSPAPTTIGGATARQTLNRVAVRDALSARAQSLATNIRSTNRFSQIEDVVGGGTIDVSYSPTIGTSLPYATTQVAPYTSWSGDIPNQFRTKLTVQFLGLNTMLYMDDVYGQRLRVATRSPPSSWERTSKLFVEDQDVATAVLGTDFNTKDTVSLVMDHPYAPYAAEPVGYADETVALYSGEDYRNADATYPGSGINDAWVSMITLTAALGNTGQGYQNLMSTLQITRYGRIPLVASYSQMDHHASTAASFLVQLAAATRIIEGASKTKLTQHHTLGTTHTVYRNTTSSGLLNLVTTTSSTNAQGLDTERRAAFGTFALAGATLEGSVPQQAEDSFESTSAIAMLVRANEDNQPFLLVNNTNWPTVSPALSSNGYDSTRIANLSQYAIPGAELIVPLEPSTPTLSMPGGSLNLGSGAEIGFFPDAIAYTVAERLKGSAAVGADEPYKAALKAAELGNYSLRNRKTYDLDANSGALTLSPPPDLVTGIGEYPASLHFRRTYSSNDADMVSCRYYAQGLGIGYLCNPAGDDAFQTILGGGWKHNFQISAQWVNNGQEGLGATSALRASTAISALYTAVDLARNATFTRRLTGVFLAYAMAGTFQKNAFLIHLPEKTQVFSRLPDNTYDAPFDDPSAQITTNSVRDGPYLLGTSTLYNYASTTLQYRSGSGDQMNFSYGTMTLVTAGGVFGFARPAFQVTDWTTPDGVKVTFTYTNVDDTNAGQRVRVLDRVDNNLGRSIDFTTELLPHAERHLTAIEDESGRDVTFATTCGPAGVPALPQPVADSVLGWRFTGSGFTTQGCNETFTVTGPDGQQTKYSYIADLDSPIPQGTLEPPTRLRKWFPPSTPTTPYLTVTYDPKMHVETATEVGSTPAHIYTAAISDEIERLGETKDPTNAVSRTYHNRYGSPTIHVDAVGNVTRHIYDSGQRRIETIFPEGNGERFQYDVRSNLLSTTRYSKSGSSQADIVGPTTIYVEGPTVQICTNLKTCNKPLSVTDSRGNPTNYSFAASTGQLLTVTGPAVTNGVSGNPLTTLCYTQQSTANGNISLLTGKIDKVNGSSNRVTSYEYAPAAGKFALSAMTVDPTTTLTPPAAGVLACNTSTKSGALNLRSTLVFDSVGNLQSLDGPRNNATDVVDITTFSFDAMRRLTRVIRPEGDITRHTFDVDGQLKTTRRALVPAPTDSNPANPWPTDLIGSQWQTETRNYFSNGNLQSVVDPENNQTHYLYDGVGRTTLVTDPLGRRVGTVYDDEGRVECVWKGWNSTTAPTDCIWDPATYVSSGYAGRFRYEFRTYSANGQTLSIQDANNNVTDYVHDGFSRLRFTLFPHATTGARCVVSTPVTLATTPSCSAGSTYEQYGYDNNNNRIALWTRKGDQVSFTFDAMNRMSGRTAANQGVITYGYNLVGETLSANKAAHGGLVARSTTYDYDGAGRRLFENNDGRQVSYQYDAAGNRERTTWPDGYFVAYRSDALNRMQYVRENSTTANEIAFFKYEQPSRRKYLCFGGQSATCESGGGTNRTGYTYELDNQLDVLTQVLNNATVTLNFGYTASDQISSIAASDDFYLSLPAAASTVAYTPDRLNRYGSIAGQTPTYDANGNVLTWSAPGGTHTYTYDSENRLLSAAVGGSSTATISYEYDALERRVKKTVGGTVTQYLLDGDEEIAELNGSGAVLRRYITGPSTDERIAQADGSSTTNPVKTYYHVNHQGSVLAMTDAAGTVTERIAYDAYGNSAGSSPTGQQFRYTGRRFDTETGLYYYRARYYSPTLGRYLQVDPIGYQDDLNLYAYTGNDPLNSVDPNGQAKIPINAVAKHMTIRNVALAGKTHPVTKIPFNKMGFPIFDKVAIKKVWVKEGFTGGPVDYARANARAKLTETPGGYTWHHHQDGHTMQLVPTKIHNKTGHTGGVKVTKVMKEMFGDPSSLASLVSVPLAALLYTAEPDVCKGGDFRCAYEGDYTEGAERPPIPGMPGSMPPLPNIDECGSMNGCIHDRRH